MDHLKFPPFIVHDVGKGLHGELLSKEKLGSLYESSQYAKDGVLSIDNVPTLLPHGFAYKHKFIKNFLPRQNDVVVAGYPRTGSTMVQEIVWSILNPSSESGDVNIRERVPLIESDIMIHELPEKYKVRGIKLALRSDISLIPILLNQKPEGNVYRTQLHASLLHENLLDRSKVIYVIRNFLDTFKSLVDYYRSMKWSNYIGFDAEFAKEFCTNRVMHGFYGEHLKDWYRFFDHPNMLVVYYEDLISSPVHMINKIHGFLNGRCHIKDDLLSQVLKRCNLNSMRRNWVKARSKESIPNSDLYTGMVDLTRGHIFPSGRIGGGLELQKRIQACLIDCFMRVLGKKYDDILFGRTLKSEQRKYTLDSLAYHTRPLRSRQRSWNSVSDCTETEDSNSLDSCARLTDSLESVALSCWDNLSISSRETVMHTMTSEFKDIEQLIEDTELLTMDGFKNIPSKASGSEFESNPSTVSTNHETKNITREVTSSSELENIPTEHSASEFKNICSGRSTTSECENISSGRSTKSEFENITSACSANSEFENVLSERSASSEFENIPIDCSASSGFENIDNEPLSGSELEIISSGRSTRSDFENILVGRSTSNEDRNIPRELSSGSDFERISSGDSTRNEFEAIPSQCSCSSEFEIISSGRSTESEFETIPSQCSSSSEFEIISSGRSTNNEFDNLP